jgi:hypothetical protein
VGETLNIDARECLIKVKRPIDKRWQFLSPRGSSRLRIHASRFVSPTAAVDAVKQLQSDNAHLVFMAVDAKTGAEVQS